MKKIGLLLIVLVPAAATLIPSRGAGQTFPGTNGLVAYTAELAAGSTICAVDPDGGTPYRLTNPEQEARDPAWSPAGDELLVTTGSVSDPQITRMPAYGMGAGATSVTSGHSPTWSPDGDRIAFARDGAIYTANIDGSGEQLLADSGSNPAWSPDGTQIAFDDELRDGTSDNGGIYLVPSAGGEIRHLSDGFEPSWSPDGSKIAARINVDATHRAITATDVTSGESTVVISGGEQGFSLPSWSPDGYRIAYSYISLGMSARAIWSVGSDGTEPRKIVSKGTDPYWQRVVTQPTPSTAEAIPCVSYPYRRSVSLKLRDHLVAEGRVRALDSEPCDSLVPVQIRKKKKSGGERIFYVRSGRSGRYKIRLPDKKGRYYAVIAPDARTECKGDRSRTKSHRH